MAEISAKLVKELRDIDDIVVRISEKLGVPLPGTQQ